MFDLDSFKSNLGQGQVIVPIRYNFIGNDRDGLPLFEIVFEEAPANYKTVAVIEAYNIAVLQVL